MLENLSGRLTSIFDGLKSKGRLTEDDINLAMREIRMALLEADVNFKVVKDFCASIKERALTAEVMDSLTPAQNVIKIVLDELTRLLGKSTSRIDFSSRIPNVIMLVGLQGSGKTTAASKLAYKLKREGHKPLLAACDTYRPAAQDQLITLGAEIGVPVYKEDNSTPLSIARGAVSQAVSDMCDCVIVDTAGRLHVDEDMMEEARLLKNELRPEYTLMVVDAMTGQDIVNVVSAFAEQVEFDGVIMTKMDGDARGGGALSLRSVTGVPIKFISAGEKPDSLEEFHPDRIAKRILGMGDMVDLIESAMQAEADEEEAARAEALAKGNFTLDDFKMLNSQIHKMGGILKLVSSLPGGDKIIGSGQIDENVLDNMEVIINSMTLEERMRPEILNASRRIRIAQGAGVTVSDVNTLIKRYDEMRKMMKKMMGNAPQPKTRRPRKGGGKKKKKRITNNSRKVTLPGGMSLADIKRMMSDLDV